VGRLAPHRKIATGFTIIEILVVVTIVAVLVAILVPVITSAKASAKTSNAASNLKQLHLNLMLYRSDWNGNDSAFDSYYDLGLPPVDYARGPLVQKNEAIMKSPCGLNLSAVNSAMFPGHPGYVSPVFATGDPSIPNQSKEFRNHIPTYRENAVMFIDVNCNSGNIDFRDSSMVKRGLSMLFSGQLRNRNATGNAAALAWYSSLPGTPNDSNS
jgi:prepilin-type N-terminal cleavage/methylation domain-containing protein